MHVEDTSLMASKLKLALSRSRMTVATLTEEAIQAMPLIAQTAVQTKSELERIFADAKIAIATLPPEGTESPLWDDIVARGKRIGKEEEEARLLRIKTRSLFIKAEAIANSAYSAAKGPKLLEAPDQQGAGAGMSTRTKKILEEEERELEKQKNARKAIEAPVSQQQGMGLTGAGAGASETSKDTASQREKQILKDEEVAKQILRNEEAGLQRQRGTVSTGDGADGASNSTGSSPSSERKGDSKESKRS